MDRKKVASNAMYYLLDFSIITIVGYILWIILAKFLVPEQYGIVFTVVSLFSVLSIITTFGMQESLPKLIPEFKKSGAASSMIFFAIKSAAIFSFAVSFLIYFFAEQLSTIFYGSMQMVLPLQFLAFVLFFGSMFFVLKAVLHGLQRFRDI